MNKTERALKYLMADEASHIDMIETIRRNIGDVRYGDTDGALVLNNGGVFMMATEDMELADRLTDWLEPSFIFAVHQEWAMNLLSAKFGYVPFLQPCHQVVYRGGRQELDESMNIKLLAEEHIDEVAILYDTEDKGYVIERIGEKALYGAFDGKTLMGFIGTHGEGSMGFLHVKQEYRRHGVGINLEKFLINDCLDKGWVPFGQFFEKNDASRALQEKLGFEISKKKMWWAQMPMTKI